jgi:hypothetical protein
MFDHRSIRYGAALFAMSLLLPISQALASDDNGQLMPPASSGFAMGLMSVNLIDSVRQLGPVRGFEPAPPAPRPIDPTNPSLETVADTKPAS